MAVGPEHPSAATPPPPAWPVAPPLQPPESVSSAHRVRFRRLIEICRNLDQVYFDGRHGALAADASSLALGVVGDLERRLGELHRLVLRSRNVSTETEDLLAADIQRIQAQLEQIEHYRRELARLTSACRQLHEQNCALERRIEESSTRVQRRDSVGRLQSAHLSARIRELEAELVLARKRQFQLERRLAQSQEQRETQQQSELARLRRELAASRAESQELAADNERLIRDRDELHADLAALRTEIIAQNRKVG